MDWKKKLAQALKDLTLIEDGFTGKIMVNLNQGGVVDIEKTERVK